MKNKQNISQAEEKLINQLLTEKFISIQPNSAHKDIIFAELSRQLPKIKVKEKKREFVFIKKIKKLWISITAGIASLLFSFTAAYAYVSPEVNRESNLYFLKRSIESIEMISTFSEENKIKKHIKFSEKRRAEVEILLSENRIDVESISEIKESIQQAADLINSIENENKKEEMQNLLQESAFKQKNSIKKVIEKFDNQEQNEEKIEIIENEKISEDDKLPPKDSLEKELETIEEIKIKEKYLPDLALLNFEINISQNNQAGTISVVLKNYGEKTEGFYLTFYKDKEIIQNLFINFIDKNETIKKEINYNFLQEGENIFSVIVDSANDIKEENEINNKLQKYINVILPCLNTCQKIDEKKCQSNFIQKCIKNSNECSSWTNIEECSKGYKCLDGECQNICENTCQNENEKKCDNNTLEICVLIDQCLSWEILKNCSQQQICQDNSCQDKCQNECSYNGETSCNNNNFQKCQNSNNSDCLEWTNSQVESGMECENSVYQDKCQNECSYNGETRCNNNDFQKCQNSNNDDCLKWRNDMPADGMYCLNDIYKEICQNTCNQKGNIKCSTSGNKVLQCDYWSNDCLSWKLKESCDSKQICEKGKCLLPLPDGIDLGDFEWEL